MQNQTVKNSWNFILKTITVLAFLFFAFLMLQITWQYIPAKKEVAFLRIKQDVTGLWYYNLAFFTHVYSSIFVLFFGFIQFSTWIRKQFPFIHKWLGRLYVIIILFLAGPSGLLMGYYGNGGWIAQVAFCLLAVLWILFTFQGFAAIKKGAIGNHEKWMYRSYALTLSAISLRLWKWAIVYFFQPKPMDVYCMVAWLGWVGNLVIAEVLLLIFVKHKIHKHKP
jgi:uncharacterized membrane protein